MVDRISVKEVKKGMREFRKNPDLCFMNKKWPNSPINFSRVHSNEMMQPSYATFLYQVVVNLIIRIRISQLVSQSVIFSKRPVSNTSMLLAEHLLLFLFYSWTSYFPNWTIVPAQLFLSAIFYASTAAVFQPRCTTAKTDTTSSRLTTSSSEGSVARWY